jgi:hypothetical protein
MLKMITKTELLQEAKVARKKGAYLYIVRSCGEVKVWVNSAGLVTVASGTPVIAQLAPNELTEPYFYWTNELTLERHKMNIDEFVDYVNEKY